MRLGKSLLTLTKGVFMSKNNTGPRVLVFDIETAPLRSFHWRMFKENIGIDQIDEDWYMLTWAAKWLGEDEILYDSLHDHKLWKKNPRDDSIIIKNLWGLIHEADVVIAHNGNKFDVKKMNARFLKHGLTPPRPYKKIDTLEIARSMFGFSSNKLDYLAQYLEVGEKIHTDWELWDRCVNGDPKAFDEMVEYNVHDVIILERVYQKLAAWSKTHPNLSLYVDDDEPICPVCLSGDIIKDGFAYTNVGKFQAYHCKNCGSYKRGYKNLLTKTKRQSSLRNIM